MEEKSSDCSNFMPGGSSYGTLGLRGSMQVNCPQNLHSFNRFMAPPHQGQDVFPFRGRNDQELDRHVSFLNYEDKVESAKNSVGDDDGLNGVEEGGYGQKDGGSGRNEFPWQRVKWMDKMVKVLVTAVSYIGEDAALGFDDCNGVGRRRSTLLPKRGKWRSISEVMEERGFHVSPQQCEDKFNDLNKRYKKLNDVLGKYTCKVVENPALMDLMELSEKAKDDVRKILSSKQLFYQEMCSFHNGNRLFLPRDRALQRSLQLVLKSKDNFEPQESRLHKLDDLDHREQDGASNDHDDETEGHAICNGNSGVSTKGKKQRVQHEEVNFSYALDLFRRDPNCLTNRSIVNHAFSQGGWTGQFWSQWMMFRLLQLEEQKLQIQVQLLELEEQRYKWLRIKYQEDRELEKMRLENECMKMENERLAFELQLREMDADYN